MFTKGRATFCICVILCFFVFCLLVDLVRLSVPMQMIDWKDSSLQCVDGDVKSYSLIHSLTPSCAFHLIPAVL